MAAQIVLKVALWILSRPFTLLSSAAELLDCWEIRRDIGRCLDVIDATTLRAPPLFITALVSAEDHRHELHCGVDPLAMIRALVVRVRSGRIQGGSTIEQQFVRVACGRYERTLTRKLREQLLAIAVARRRSKRQIAESYLSVAFYGSCLQGTAGLLTVCGADLHTANQRHVFGVIARLKYPEPSQPTLQWETVLQRRIQYIERRFKTVNLMCAPGRKRC